MYSSWSSELREYHAHQRKIVRHFAPHLTDAELTRQERIYFVVGIIRALVVFVIPSVIVLLWHPWFLMTPAIVVVALVCSFEVVMAIYRRMVLWPEGLQMRRHYWREIEISEDCYHLKIMGFYHRKIAQFVGHFPPSMSSSAIRRSYRQRGVFLITLFSAAYVVFLLLMPRLNNHATAQIWMAYLLAIASGQVVFRFVKMHLIELPLVLILRELPEFAVILNPATETIPFARPVPAYQAVQLSTSPPMAEAVVIAPADGGKTTL